MAWVLGGWFATRANQGAGAWAAREAVARGDLDGGLALLDTLLGVTRAELGPPPGTVAPPRVPVAVG
jgi:hypothetical protein